MCDVFNPPVFELKQSLLIIPVLLGCPGERHPVLAEALARLFSSFQHLLGRLWTQRQTVTTDPRAACAVLNVLTINVREGGDLGDVRGLHVWLSAVCDAILQHLLHPGHQEDVCMGVGHREDALREFNT